MGPTGPGWFLEDSLSLYQFSEHIDVGKVQRVLCTTPKDDLAERVET